MKDLNVTRDDDRGAEILTICGATVGLALFIVALRVWVRAKMIRHMGWDDYFIVAAMTVMFTEMMIIIPQVGYGAGRHVENIKPEENVVKGLHLNFVTQPLCLIALCLTKVSVGLFLLRLSPPPRFRYLVWGVILFTVLSSTGNLLTVFFQCQPLAFVWDTSVPGGQCIPAANLKFAAFFNSSVAAFTDLLFALLPIPMLWDVKLNWKIKIIVTGVLSLGIFATAAAIVKITYLGNYGKYGDFLYDSSDLTIWTTIEICTAIVAASIPCLKPLFKTLLAGSSAQSHGPKYDQPGYRRSRGTSERGGGRARAFGMYVHSGRVGDQSVKTLSRTGSEEKIILQEGPQQSGIVKTTQLSMSVDYRA